MYNHVLLRIMYTMVRIMRAPPIITPWQKFMVNLYEKIPTRLMRNRTNYNYVRTS